MWNADTNNPGNIIVWANDPDIKVILICNIDHKNSDLWYDSRNN